MKADTSKPKAVTKAPATAAKVLPPGIRQGDQACGFHQGCRCRSGPRGREPASSAARHSAFFAIGPIDRTIDGPGSGFHRCQSQLPTHHAHDRASATYLHRCQKDPKLANNWKTKTAEELTDAEVMAMPDSEYMNDKQMAFFRLKLVQLKQDIHNSAGETTEHLREDTVVVPDPPTAPPSRKSTPWSCAPATASASCSRRSNNRSRASTRATTATATKRASPSAWAA